MIIKAHKLHYVNEPFKFLLRVQPEEPSSVCGFLCIPFPLEP